MWLMALALASSSTHVTVYQVLLFPDGSAEWTIEHRFPLSTPEEAEAFEEVSSGLENLTIEYRATMESLVAEASLTLARPMKIEDFKVEAEIVKSVSGEMGLIEVAFVWRGFGRVAESGYLEVGDVFVGGFYLSDGETFRVTVPKGFEISEVKPAPDGVGTDYAEWRGRIVFPDGEPRIVLRPIATAWLAPQALRFDMVLLNIAIASTLALSITYAVLRRRGRRPPRESELDTVLRVIKSHGGVVYQSQIVRESGLSKSTVSTILKTLEAEGRVVREKEGREKLVRLAR